MTEKVSETRCRRSCSFAHQFEEIVQVLSRLIVDASRAHEESHEPFEARQRLLVWLSTQVGLDIGKGEI